MVRKRLPYVLNIEETFDNFSNSIERFRKSLNLKSLKLCNFVLFIVEVTPTIIAVNKLKQHQHTTVEIGKMIDEFLHFFKEESHFTCSYSNQGEGFFKGLKKENQVIQLNNLILTSLPTYKNSKMIFCTDHHGHNMVYLGSTNGTLLVDQHYSVKDPQFFVHNNWGSYEWYVDAVGKFYPCQKEGKDEPNAVYSATGKTTVLRVTKNIQFSPSWPHIFMADHGENLADSWMSVIENNFMHMSNKLHWNSLLKGNSFHTNVRDNDMILQFNSTSRRHKVSTDWVVNRHSWEADIQIHNDQWRPFVEDFFPDKMIFVGFEIKKLGQALPHVIDGNLKVSPQTTTSSEHLNILIFSISM